MASEPVPPEVAKDQRVRDRMVRELGGHLLGVFLGVFYSTRPADRFWELMMDHKINCVWLGQELERIAIVAHKSHVVDTKPRLHWRDSKKAVVGCHHGCGAASASTLTQISAELTFFLLFGDETRYRLISDCPHGFAYRAVHAVASYDEIASFH